VKTEWTSDFEQWSARKWFQKIGRKIKRTNEEGTGVLIFCNRLKMSLISWNVSLLVTSLGFLSTTRKRSARARNGTLRLHSFSEHTRKNRVRTKSKPANLSKRKVTSVARLQTLRYQSHCFVYSPVRQMTVVTRAHRNERVNAQFVKKRKPVNPVDATAKVLCRNVPPAVVSSFVWNTRARWRPFGARWTSLRVVYARPGRLYSSGVRLRVPLTGQRIDFLVRARPFFTTRTYARRRRRRYRITVTERKIKINIYRIAKRVFLSDESLTCVGFLFRTTGLRVRALFAVLIDSSVPEEFSNTTSRNRHAGKGRARRRRRTDAIGIIVSGRRVRSICSLFSFSQETNVGPEKSADRPNVAIRRETTSPPTARAFPRNTSGNIYETDTNTVGRGRAEYGRCTCSPEISKTNEAAGGGNGKSDRMLSSRFVNDKHNFKKNKRKNEIINIIYFPLHAFHL